MSDFTVINYYDGSSQGVNNGGALNLTVQTNTTVEVSQNLDMPGGQATQVTAGSGFNPAGATFIAGMGSMTIRANSLMLCTAAPGTLETWVQFENQVIQYFRINLTVAAPAAVAQIVVPTSVFDLNWDVDMRKLYSTVLGNVDGFKTPDTINFAVIPQRAGSLISSGITALTATLRQQGKYNCDPLWTTTIASPSLSGSSPNQYYALALPLSQPGILNYFTQADDLALGGASGGPNQAQLPVSLELEITESSGVSTSDVINFMVFQSLIQPAPA